ncbi:MAG: heparan-alpha-glucosaminide N-acetyltransferase domain-containing protein [Verrucomicrobiales bacterium]
MSERVRPREDRLDALRGLAVIGMLETHAVNALLAPLWREEAWFTALDAFNGLVAPTFLWIAGYAHGLGSRARAESDARWRRAGRRLLFICALGYALHLPEAPGDADWRRGFNVDILPCLAVTLLLVLAVERWLPRRGTVLVAFLAGAVVLAGALPPDVLTNLTGFWPLDAWFDQSGRSLFPVIPWSGFVLLGVLMAWWPGTWWVWAATAGLVGAQFAPHSLQKSHPSLFFVRFFIVAVAADGLRKLGHRITFPRWLTWVGRESLAFYVVHLALLYWLPTTRWFGPRLDPLAVLAVAVALLVVSAAIVRLGRQGMTRWKHRHGAPKPRANAVP